MQGLKSFKALFRLVPTLFAVAVALPVFAQTPNTAALVVAVVDQTGAVVGDARVRVINRETGATRDAVSNTDGVAAIGALPLTGTYTINVSKAGFTADEVTDLSLRAQETATVKVTPPASTTPRFGTRVVNG